MYNYKIKLSAKLDGDLFINDVVFEQIERYWHALFFNGQILGNFDIVQNKNDILLTAILPEKSSLDAANNNQYVREIVQSINELFNIEIIYEGINLEYGETCTCKTHEFYYLSAQHEFYESGFFCGNCFKYIPLYMVAYIQKQQEHFLLTNWLKSYSNINGLWCGLGLWDRFSYGELNKHNSKLNRLGQEICREYEKVLDKPVYLCLYYVHGNNDIQIAPKGLANEPPKKCPKCEVSWTHYQTYYKCEMCRFIIFQL